MSRVLYLEPVGGIAGDMFMAACIDLGVDVAVLDRALQGLRIGAFRLAVSKQVRHSITGTHLDVVVEEGQDLPQRGLSEISELIRRCETLSDEVKKRALRTFEIIGEAEAKVHGVPLSEVHFHEVGAVDSIVDICGAAVALEALGFPEVLSAPPPMGSGIAKMAHGQIPIPPPATLEILKNVPVKFEGVGELTTPTGAALLKAHAKVGVGPSLIPERVGYGVGTKDFRDRANVLRATLGRSTEQAATLTVVEANLDDCSPQLLGLLIERVIALGALDAWITPATMKKSRPGHVFSALLPSELQDRVSALLFAESTTLGLRSYQVARTALERRFDEVQTRFGPVRVKVGVKDGAVVNANPEFEDCRAIAEKQGVAVKEVWAQALAEWTKR